MTTLQPFKENDTKEQKVKDAFLPILNLLGDDRDSFYEGAYECFVLGDVLFLLKRDPLAGVVTQETFRQSFFAIHNLFTRPGTFEFYLEVFRAVWGDDVAVNFSVPAPGKLLISIEALTVQLDDWLARRIENDTYIFDEIIDHEGDNIQLRGTQGIKTQNETEALVNELYPAGLWVQTTLVIS